MGTLPPSLKLFFALSLLGMLILPAGCGRKAPETKKRWATIRTDSASIDRGEELFNAHCRYCHDPYSTRMKAGPGLLGILRKPGLPYSGRPATPENIREQMIRPTDHMPSFDHLTEEEANDILAFLNTL